MAKKYGYKGHAIGLKGLSGAQLIEMIKSPAVRLFKNPFGENTGETLIAGNVPWAGATEGATNTEEAIAKLETVMSAGQIANIRAFADGATAAKGKTGSVWVTYPSGKRGRLPLAAVARSEKFKIGAGEAE